MHQLVRSELFRCHLLVFVCKCASASFQIGERTTNIGYDTKAAVAKAKSDTNKGGGIKRRFVSEPASLRHKTICLSRVGWLSNVSLFFRRWFKPLVVFT